tara:strand:- start:1088 stop:1450 length:363 start_codon:yes stop_codon:yes gene_type:complete
MELVEDLQHIFGEDRVMVIDEKTDFSKLPNPFKFNSLVDAGLLDPETMKMDGYDDCIVGIVEGFGSIRILCYDKEKVLERLMGDGMEYNEAQEYYEFNMLGAFMGEGTPCFIDKTEWQKS